MPETIEISEKGRVAVVRLDRPKQLNALNLKMADEMIDALSELDQNPAIGCIVITGNERAFAAGADIKEMVDKTYAEVSAVDFGSKWQQVAKLRTPKIAAVNGFALGGGCELAMACDFIIAGNSAQFGQPEIKLGVIAGFGGSQRMTKLIGRAKSMDMHLTGRMMGAEEALSSGLVARVVEDEKTVDTAMEVAAEIAEYSNHVASLARDAVMRADEVSLEEGMIFERRIFHSLFGTEDQKEGMTAFVEKRKANFNRS